MKKRLALIFLFACQSVYALHAGGYHVETSGFLEINSDYYKKTDEKRVDQNGYLQLDFRGGKESRDRYVRGKASFRIGLNGAFDEVQDAYITIGKGDFYIDLGRFEEMQIYNIGDDIILANVVSEYDEFSLSTPYLVDLADTYSNNEGQLAFNYLASENVKLQLGTRYGTNSSNNRLGLRPSAHFTWGYFNTRLAYEYLTDEPQSTQTRGNSRKNGYGLTVYAEKDEYQLGANFSMSDEKTSDGAGRTTQNNRMTYSIFFLFGVEVFTDAKAKERSFGITLMQTEADDDQPMAMKVEEKQTQLLLAYIAPFFVEGATWKVAYSKAQGSKEVAGVEILKREAHVGRIQVNYAF